MGNFAEDLMKGKRFARKGGHWWGIGNPHLILKCEEHGEYSKHHDDPDQGCPKCKKAVKMISISMTVRDRNYIVRRLHRGEWVTDERIMKVFHLNEKELDKLG
jgi:hypothetical protein